MSFPSDRVRPFLRLFGGTLVAAAVAATLTSTARAQQPVCATDASGNRLPNQWCAGDLFLGVGTTVDTEYLVTDLPPGTNAGRPLYTQEYDPVYVDNLDVNGDPILDEYGNPWVPQLDANGNRLFYPDGQPEYVQWHQGDPGAPTVDAFGNSLLIYTTTPVDGGKYLVHDQSGNDTGGILHDSTGDITMMCAEDPLTGDLWTTSLWTNQVSHIHEPVETSPGVFAAPVTDVPLDVTQWTREPGCGLFAADEHMDCGGVKSVAFDRAGNMYVGTRDGTDDILEFSPARELIDAFDVPVGESGADWIEIANDNKTIFYTSEDRVLRVFYAERDAAGHLLPIPQALIDAGVEPAVVDIDDPGSALVAPDEPYRFGQIPLRAPNGAPASNTLHQVRLLPPGDGSGDLLVATEADVYRIGLDGTIKDGYLGGGTNQPAHGAFFSLDISPDGRAFWASTIVSYDGTFPSYLYQVDIARRARLVDGETGPDWFGINGMCVRREYTAGGAPDCSDAANAGNRVCQALPICEINDPRAECQPPGQPTIDPLPDRFDKENDVIDFTVVADSGAPGDPTLQFTSSTLPLGITLDPDTGRFSGTLDWHAGEQVGPGLLVKVGVTNAQGLTVLTTFVWHVENVNAPPTIAVSPAPFDEVTREVTVTSPHGLPVDPVQVLSGSDPDPSDLVTYLPADGSLPPGLALQQTAARTGQIVGTPTTVGSYDFTLVGTDNIPRDPLLALQTLVFEWTITNSPPGIDAIAPIATHGAGPTVTAHATDPNGDALTFSLAGSPAGFAIDAETGVISTTSTAPGAHTLTVEVDDGHGGTASMPFDWTITNAPPTIDPIGAVTLARGAGLNIVAHGTDPDGDPLTYTVTGLPGAFSFDPVTHQFSGSSPATVPATTVTVTATDGFLGGSASTTFTLSVVNVPPVWINPPAAQFTQFGQTVSLSLAGRATDADGDLVTYTVVSSLPAGLSLVGNTITGTPGVTPPSGVPVTLRANDPYGAFAATTFNWVVSANRPPVCTATASPAVLWPANHKFVPITIQGIVDPDGDPILITVTRILQDEPTMGTDSDDNDEGRGSGHTDVDGYGVGTPTAWVRAERSGHGDGRVYVISYTASDGKGGTCTSSVTVAVPHDKKDTAIDSGVRYDSTVAGGAPLSGPAFNLPPVYSAVSAQRTASGNSVSLPTMASDPNHDTLMFSALQGGVSTLPPGLVLDRATGRITGTPTTPGTYHVVLTASDPFGAIDTVAFDWTVAKSKANKKDDDKRKNDDERRDDHAAHRNGHYDGDGDDRD